MAFEYFEFHVQKDGNSPEDYEDSSAVSENKRRIAIADGTSESFCAGRWANLLTNGFVNDKSEPFLINEELSQARIIGVDWLKQWIDPLQIKWREGIDTNSISLYAREKFRIGAYATLLGLVIFREKKKKNLYKKGWLWRAIAVGDSCLFLVRKKSILDSFPFQSTKDFKYHPDLLSSRKFGNEQIWEQVKAQSDGTCKQGDFFILATDALSKWIFSQTEAQVDSWFELCEINEITQFQDFVKKQRIGNKLPNDDTTLVILKIK